MVAFFPSDFLDADGDFRDLLPGDFVPIVYRMADGSWVCADCVNLWRHVDDPLTTDDPAFRIASYELHYEGPIVVCDRCDAIIESLYGE